MSGSRTASAPRRPGSRSPRWSAPSPGRSCTIYLKDERSVMISIRSIKGFRRGEYDMITAHIEDLIEDEYRRRKRQDNKVRKEKRKETIPIEEEAIAFVIGKFSFENGSIGHR